MGKVKEIVIELENLKKELDWYIQFDSTNHLVIEEIQKHIFILEDRLKDNSL
jgi:hypothetical protein